MSVPSITNCPNCGAPIDSDKCPYCGTRLINIADLEIGEKIWLIFKDRDRGVSRGVRIMVNHISVTESQDAVTFYADSEPCYFASPNLDISVSIDGTCTPNEKGVLGVMVDEKVADDPNIRRYI